MTISSLVLTDGTTTATLTDGTNYALTLAGWAPQVAGVRENQLGAHGPYADVTEEIELDVMGSSLSVLLANLARLSTLVTQAQRWADGELGVSAVTLQITMSGGSAYEAVVLGGEVEPPATYADKLPVLEFERVTLRVVRRGAWLLAAETAATSASTAVGNVWTITLASSHEHLSPVRLTWTMPVSGRDPVDGVLIVANSSSDLAVLEGETLGAGGAFSTTSPAGSAVARGGSVLRFTTPAGLRESRAFSYANIPSVLKSGPARVDVWAVGYAEPDALFTLRWYYRTAGEVTANRYTTAIPVLGEDSVTKVFHAGTFDVPEAGIAALSLDMEGPTAGDIFDLDYFVFVVRKPTTFLTAPSLYADTNVFGSGNALRGLWDATQTTYPDPIIGLERTSGGTTRTTVSAAGDLWVGAQGGTLAGIWLAVEMGIYRYPSTDGGSTALSSTFSVQRRRAHRVVS